MNTTTLAIIFAATTLLILAACAFAVFTQHLVIRELRAVNVDLLNRLYVSKGQPPVGVDVRREYEEKKQQRDERRRDPAQKSAIDPTQGMRNRLASMEKTRANKAS